MATREGAPRYPIESVDNALKLLLLLKAGGSVTGAEASRQLGVAPSTAHRLLTMLEHRGFAEREPGSKAYRPGAVLTEIGLGVLRSLDIRTVARHHLEQLVAEVGETAHLVLVRDTDILFVDCVESPRTVRAASRVGQSLPAHATAAGKALLARLPESELKRRYASERLTTVTSRTVSTRSRLLEELAVIRERGYAVNDGESEVDLVATAAAIVDRSGTARAAVTVAAPRARVDGDSAEAMAPRVVLAAVAIGEALE